MLHPSVHTRITGPLPFPLGTPRHLRNFPPDDTKEFAGAPYEAPCLVGDLPAFPRGGLVIGGPSPSPTSTPGSPVPCRPLGIANSRRHGSAPGTPRRPRDSPPDGPKESVRRPSRGTSCVPSRRASRASLRGTPTVLRAAVHHSTAVAFRPMGPRKECQEDASCIPSRWHLPGVPAWPSCAPSPCRLRRPSHTWSHRCAGTPILASLLPARHQRQ